MQPSKKNTTINKEEDDDVIIFEYKRPLDKDPLEQLIVNPNRPSKKVKLTEQEQFSEEFMSKFSLKASVQYFLARVDSENAQTKINGLIRNRRQQKLQRDSKSKRQLRESIINKIRYGKQSENQKVKIVNIASQDFVDFKGQKIPVQNMPSSKDYYILQKRVQTSSNNNGPSIYLPEQAGHLLQPQNQSDQESVHNMSDEDSNREDHPDFDYPEEDFSGSSDEGVLDNQQYPSSQEELDEEQIYRRYLKRCKKYEKQGDSDDDIEYSPYP